MSQDGYEGHWRKIHVRESTLVNVMFWIDVRYCCHDMQVLSKEKISEDGDQEA